MIKKIALTLLAIVAVVLIYAATKPDAFTVQRSTEIVAKPDKVFGLIADLRQFNRWNPWLKADPSTQLTYGATTTGTGATYSWAGGSTGAGSMTVDELQPPGRVTFKLDFVKPFEGHNIAEFVLQPTATGTTVTWAMRGPMPYLSKVMDTVMGMDRMIGTSFEDGLATLKALAEQP